MSDPVRRRLLRLLEDAGESRTASSLATTVGLHPNTVRGHLEMLERAGLVTKAPENRKKPGRPRMLYMRSGEAERPGGSGYRFLAEMLATSLRTASEEPAQVAENTGREWGRYLTDGPPPRQTLTSEESVHRLIKLLVDYGFDPDAEEKGTKVVIGLRDCPFRDLARNQSDLVCSIHLGLLRGTAEALGGRATVESLEPFVEPSLCRVMIQRT